MKRIICLTAFSVIVVLRARTKINSGFDSLAHASFDRFSIAKFSTYPRIRLRFRSIGAAKSDAIPGPNPEVIFARALSGGCGGGSGGGTRSIAAGTAATTAAYGWGGADNQLGFVIFTGMDSQGTIGSASGKWTGYIKPTTGPTVRYKSISGSLDINGINYGFANGRVFLASTKEGKISVSQLDIPISDSNYDAEIDRIAELEEVQEFLSK